MNVNDLPVGTPIDCNKNGKIGQTNCSVRHIADTNIIITAIWF